MNPPSVLQGAMSRERKPFTYTPGGLDLSEIKSERMAKRLMRNAMNQGVPEVPVHQVQSPQTPSTPIAVPNFNCLPVQVFPAMPANPRSLLRTRSHPEQPKEPIVQRPQPNQYENTCNKSFYKQNPVPPLQRIDKPVVDYQPPFNNNYNSNMNRPVTMFEYNSTPGNYGSVNFTPPVLPEISYEAEYLQAPNRYEKPNNTYVPEIKNNNLSTSTEDLIVFKSEPIVADKVMVPQTVTVLLESNEDQNSNNNDQREVRVVKKKENKVEESETNSENHNGNHNGVSESAVTVKTPPKKAAAKTETKVEVVQRTLSDGSVEEVKTTTTKTTIDGKTQITTKIETTIIPKEDDEEYEEIEVEEEQEEEEQAETNESETIEEPTTVVVLKKTGTNSSTENKENGQSSVIVTEEESSEIVSSKKVTVTQNNNEVELEEVKEVNNNSVIESAVNTIENQKEEVTETNSESKEQDEPTVVVSVKLNEQKHEEVETKKETIVKNDVQQENGVEAEEGNESEYTEEEYESEVEHIPNNVKKEEKPVEEIPKPSETKDKEENVTHEAVSDDTVTQEVVSQETVSSKAVSQETLSQETVSQEIVSHETVSQETVSKKDADSTLKPDQDKPADEETVSKPTEALEQQEHNIEITHTNRPLREPSIPLEKVEDVEIKPIGAQAENISKTHSENTEFITSSNDKSSGVLSTQTEYNRVENIVTVNRTTKTLDQSYEQLTQGQPTMKTYFAPNRENVSISPSKPYQPTFTPEPQPERRHSLLLERLSLERQTPTIDSGYQNTYQYTNQGFEHQRQWSQEPQSEVLNVSNVKPSKITNQEWFQQSRKENVSYSDETATGALNVPVQQLHQPQQQSQPMPAYQPPPPPQPQPQYQQTQYQPPAPQKNQQPYHYQAQFQPKPTPPPQTQYQAPHITSQVQDFSKTSNHVYEKQTSFPPYIPTPATQNTWENNVSSFSSNTQSNQYSFSNQSSSETYQKSSQSYSSSYVPPPWEQDSTYNAVNNTQYQPSTPVPSVTPAPPLPTSNNQHWNPQTPQAKFSKTTPASYTPPAPNQSFVRTDGVIEPPSLPGRKTYYSEYERRYITVPESTYIPAETKFQAQPDPSPQYYFDKNEPAEQVEPQWRKELREFTEKSQTETYQSEQTSVRPPWEEEVQYAKNPSVKYTPTPSWSQTLRPQSWRERSFEAESVATQDFAKTSTLGRGRPLSTYSTNEVDNQLPRSRGVSVDRYNPVYYRSPVPSEHSPVQVQTLTPETAPQRKGHQHPGPGYNARASAEPRDPSAQFQQKRHREVKENPVQSRSFKYLQWITGTED